MTSATEDPFEPIDPSKLNVKHKKIYNFQQTAAILADYGFNCIKLVDDWNGADFLALHIPTGKILKVQLKGRVTINEKYMGKDIWMNFSDSRATVPGPT